LLGYGSFQVFIDFLLKERQKGVTFSVQK